jgi:hypothetical protein
MNAQAPQELSYFAASPQAATGPPNDVYVSYGGNVLTEDSMRYAIFADLQVKKLIPRQFLRKKILLRKGS